MVKLLRKRVIQKNPRPAIPKRQIKVDATTMEPSTFEIVDQNSLALVLL